MMMLNSLDYVHVTIALSVTAWVVLNMMSDDVDSFFFWKGSFKVTTHKHSHRTERPRAVQVRCGFSFIARLPSSASAIKSGGDKIEQ